MLDAQQMPEPTADAWVSNDYHLIPATEKQLKYARRIAERSNLVLPYQVQQDRRALSKWIDDHLPKPSAFSQYPSSKQVAFAERIARIKRREVPHICFRDKNSMSKWIDSNK